MFRDILQHAGQAEDLVIIVFQGGIGVLKEALPSRPAHVAGAAGFAHDRFAGRQDRLQILVRIRPNDGQNFGDGPAHMIGNGQAIAVRQ